MTRATTLDQRLGDLLQVGRFDPPPSFAGQAAITDPLVFERAADGPAWWAEQARQRLAWHRPFSTVLDDSNPPFYQWFSDGALNVSYNCLDRHVEAGLGDRVAFHWLGEEGEQRACTYADMLADVQRLANGLKAHGVRKGDVVGIYLALARGERHDDERVVCAPMSSPAVGRILLSQHVYGTGPVSQVGPAACDHRTCRNATPAWLRSGPAPRGRPSPEACTMAELMTVEQHLRADPLPPLI